jgi:hypothetical protein
VRSAALVSVVLDAPAIAVNAIRAAKRSAMVVGRFDERDRPARHGGRHQRAAATGARSDPRRPGPAAPW